MKQLQVDPEFRDLIQPLTAEEYKQLEENIANDCKCREPIVTWNNIIIDGHNRYKICKEYDIPFETISKEFTDKLDAKIWIIKNQLGKRNIEPYQKGKLVLYMQEYIQEKAKANKILAAKNNKGNQYTGKLEKLLDSTKPPKEEIKSIHTRKELADMSGISTDTIYKTQKIQEGIEQGNEVAIELDKQLQTGEIKLDKAYHDLKDKTDIIKPRPRVKKEIIEVIIPKKEIITPTQIEKININKKEEVIKEVEDLSIRDEVQEIINLIRKFNLESNIHSRCGIQAIKWSNHEIKSISDEVELVQSWVNTIKESLNYAKENK